MPPKRRFPAPLTPSERALIAGVTAADLKSHVSFLASDALEGRDTPSAGLTIAGEYIASRFRAAGLEPAGDDGYFQKAAFGRVTPLITGFDLSVESGGQTVHANKEKSSVMSLAAADLVDVPLVRFDALNPSATTADAARGKILVMFMPPMADMKPEERRPYYIAAMSFGSTVKRLEAAAGIVCGYPRGGGWNARLRTLDPLPPVMQVSDEVMTKALAQASAATLHIAAPAIEPVNLRNVIGVLRGSDPKLKDTFVLVTAHYDHLGVNRALTGDQIFNGANDDASGTASVLSLVEAFAHAPVKPKRTLVFIAYFGEEKGLLGSRYYATHPVFPLARTVADLNLEQTGRTDDTEGVQIKRFAITGFDYSDLGKIIAAAAKREGVTAFKHEKNSDQYFGASDNQALADAGVPAHTISVAYVFPDYHKVGDHWERIDYANMETVVRAIALAVNTVGNSATPPKWDAANPKVQPYREAAEKLKAQ